MVHALVRLSDVTPCFVPLRNIGATKISSNVLFEQFKSDVSTDQFVLANVLREAILIRDGVLLLNDSRFLP